MVSGHRVGSIGVARGRWCVVRSAERGRRDHGSHGHTGGEPQGEVRAPSLPGDDTVVTGSPGEDFFELDLQWTSVRDLRYKTGVRASPARSGSVSGPAIALPRVHGGLPDGDSGRRPGLFSPSGQSSHGRICQADRVKASAYVDRHGGVLNNGACRGAVCLAVWFLEAGPTIATAERIARLRAKSSVCSPK